MRFRFRQVFCATLLWSPDVSYGTMVVHGTSLRVLDPLRVCSLFYPPSLGMGHMRTTFYTPLFVCDTDAKRPKNRFPRNKIAVWLFSETSVRLGPCRRLVPSPSRFFAPLRVFLSPLRCLLFVLDPPSRFFLRGPPSTRADKFSRPLFGGYPPSLISVGTVLHVEAGDESRTSTTVVILGGLNEVRYC